MDKKDPGKTPQQKNKTKQSKKPNVAEKIFSAPAQALEKGIEAEHKLEKNIKKQKPVKVAREYWKILGPGLTTGAADDDPSGIATYSQIGASKGFGLIWLSVFTLPLMTVVHEISARIGLATGLGLAANIRRYYSRRVLYLCTLLLVVANVFNLGANLGAMAEATQLVLPKASFTLLVFIFALFSLFLQISMPYKKYSKYLKYMAFVLFAYVLAALSINMDWGQVLHSTFVPRIVLTKEVIILIAAALGTTISPYLLFWQTSQEVEEQIAHGDKTQKARKKHTNKKTIRRMRIDVISGMFLSNLVMFFIIATSATVLFGNGITEINSAADAAAALRPLAGDSAFLLFALGIVGTGLLAIPILAGSASYAVSESMGWKFGFSRRRKQASAFYGVIIVAILLGIAMNFIGLDPIKTLIYAAILNGLVAPVIIFFLMRLSDSGKVMGRFKNGHWVNALGWLTFTLMAVVGLLTVGFILL